MKLLLVTLILLWISIGCSAYNILVFLPLHVWSHYVQVEPIFIALAERGHNLTVYSTWPPKKAVPNFHHTFLTTSKMKEKWGSFNSIQSSLSKSNFVTIHMMWQLVSETIGDEILSSDQFQDLIRNDHGHRFDLIFTELFFGTEFFSVLNHKLGAPIVSYSSFGYDSKIHKFTGASNAFAYLPDKSSNYPSPMTLFQRLDNAITHVVSMGVLDEYWHYPLMDKLLAKYVPGPLPSVTSMLKNISLHFFTGNVAVDGSRLLPQNVVELAGTQIKAPSPLPKDLQAVMNKATNGVIYFSFGSLVKASYFKKEDIELLLSVFKQLDQTVLWKTDFNSTEVILPKNVILKNWFDQSSILSHPNCALFFTHGGISSIMEAINFAVPVLGMPFYGDQPHNMAFAEKYGYGLTLEYKDLTHDSLLGSIKKVLGDPKYKKNIERGSRIFRDSPMSGVDTAIYWIEYVIRHEGAHHLKPVTVQMPWYQEFLLDVIVIFVTIFSVFMYILLKIFSFLVFCYRKFGKKSMNEKKKEI